MKSQDAGSVQLRYRCEHPDCGRSYSRLEHLQRHRLNHYPAEIYTCQHPGCRRTFVRWDLFVRHQQRHGNGHVATVQRTVTHHDNVLVASLQASYGAAGTAQFEHVSDQQSGGASISTSDNLPSICNGEADVMATTGAMALEDVDEPAGDVVLSGSQIGALPALDAQDVSEESRINLSSWFLDSMTNFQPTYFPLHIQTSFGEAMFNADSFMPPEPLEWSDAQPSPMVSASIADDSSRPSSKAIGGAFQMSRKRWQELVSLIEKRFHGTDNEHVRRIRDSLLRESVYVEDHPLRLGNIQEYVSAYFDHFHPQLPILHKPTFSAEDAHVYLLLAITMIGTAYLGPSQRHLQDAAAQLGTYIAWHLRWQVFMHEDYQPPAKLWVLQTLLLVELYDKTNGPRSLHERGHLMFPTTVNLMRRGIVFVEQPDLGTCQTTTNPDEWWHGWITAEATRRVAFGAFHLDTINATIFGHAATMAVNEMRLLLPCDDALWSATSPTETARIQASLHANGFKPIMFQHGLKSIISGKGIHTNPFGRLTLITGLLSLVWHMNRQDTQVSNLGIDQASCNSQWKATLSRAIDFWRADFDKHTDHGQSMSLPWQRQAKAAGAEVVKQTADLLYRISHITIHVELYEHQIFAGLRKALGRTVSSEDTRYVRQKFSDWNKKPGSKAAAFHAVKMLRELIRFSNRDGAPRRYDACHDITFLRPYYFYIAATTIWSFCYSRDGIADAWHSEDQRGQDETPLREEEAIQEFLDVTELIDSPEDMVRYGGKMDTTAVLNLLIDAFHDSKWDLLREAGTLLQNAVNFRADCTT